ncbi:hypothetical protein Tasa_048_194 [Tanticharoenia sakaeratensis NBRC 103193]|uniref:Uncharacterized protein n=2 Tax=Tanticharoenia TaxID=444052 RepID=A0A0D6MPE8_9PROT|nr:hypothetical protein Tasa_048_194 [Tanticharoenia sakaeratensis NBRC 103193]GBQ21714.1 hypothetical protein AA103193_1819 [Tanticharoenia sakaeratensis NBRC 103193]
MPAFDSYPPVSKVAGSEVFVCADAAGENTLTVTAAQIAGAPAVSEPSGALFASAGSQISRLADRLFVGAATDCPGNENDGSSSTGSADWLSTMMGKTSIGPWAMRNAQGASLARFGNTGFVGASRTSDAQNASAALGYVPSSIGVASWGVADETANPTTTTAYAYYGEAWRLSNVNYQPTFGMELECVNFGGLAVGLSTPFSPNVGGGVYGLQLGAGGGQTSGTSDAAAGIVFVSNPNAFQTGIVFSATSLSGTNGADTGYGAAISMARNQAIEWHTPETVSGAAGTNVGAFIRSTVGSRANGMRQEFTDNALLFSNIDGTPVFSIENNAQPTNILSVQAGSAGQAAGLYVEEGASGSPHLGLYPASGGELQITSPVSDVGGALPSSVGGGFLHINVNGSDFRIPLLLPSQAGG